jgi:hypothetical protein
MSGKQWLNQVFRSTVTAVNRARHDRSIGVIPLDRLRVVGGRLAAQVEALVDTGVLIDEQERAALNALVEAGIMPEVRSASVSMSSTGASAPVAVRAGSAPVAARVPDEPPRLLGVVAGPRQLGQLDGRPVTLISAELWSDRLLVDLYTDPGPEYRSRQTRMTREHLEWIRSQRHGQQHGHATQRPGPPLADPPPQGLIWELRDEQGTEYYRTGGSAASEHYVERQRMQWSPAPPADSGRVTLLATDAAGTVVLDTEVLIPKPAR